MEFINHFTQTYLAYIKNLWFSLFLGFLLSGLFYVFIPTPFVERFLGTQGSRPIWLITLVGVVLPVCCFGSLPIAITLRRKGARLGPVLAFLVATPATSIPALIICWRLLGWLFTVYIFGAVILMGLIVGWMGNKLPLPGSLAKGTTDSCCDPREASQTQGFFHSLQRSFVYAFVTLPKEIGLELLLGIGLASLIIVYEPLQGFIQQYLTGARGYLLVILGGLATYVCSTASVPMADALLKSGMSSGQVMTYLLVGPITSYGTIFAMKKEFGGKILLFYLFSVSVLSLILGILFDAIIY